MRIAVVGVSGQLATSLLELGAARGLPMTALGRPQVDITDAPAVARAIDDTDANIVVNTAAYTAVDRAETDTAAAFAVNAAGAGNVAEACARRRLPLIHISTDYVYGGDKASPYIEDDATGPLGVYGRSKLEGESSVARACPQHIILRTSWVHSPFGGNFVKTMLRLARERDEVAVVSDQRGCPTYAPHMAAAILAIAEQVGALPDAPWGVYHAAGSGEATWYDLASAVFQASRALGGSAARVRPIPTSAYPTAAVRPMNSRLDTDKLARAFDVRLPDWHEGVRACVARLLRDVVTA